MHKWYQSRTFYLNIATFVALIISLPELGRILPTEFIPYVAFVNAALNLYIRFEPRSE